MKESLLLWTVLAAIILSFSGCPSPGTTTTPPPTTKVYAGGWSGNSNGTTVAGYWLNGTWTTYGDGVVVISMAVSGSNIYAGGSGAGTRRWPERGRLLAERRRGGPDQPLRRFQQLSRQLGGGLGLQRLSPVATATATQSGRMRPATG